MSGDHEEEMEGGEGEEEEWEDMEDGSDGDEEEGTSEGDKKSSEKKNKKRNVYIPGKSKLEEGEEPDELECDLTAYHFLHHFETENACLSFDTIIDRDGQGSSEYPASCCIVAGTQADKVRDNGIIVANLGNIHGTKPKGEDESESESDEEEEEEGGSKNSKKPQMKFARIVHHGGINRIRVRFYYAHRLNEATNIRSARVCAVWNEAGKVQIWNLANAYAAVQKDKSTTLKNEKPLHTFPGHNSEGYGLDWSIQKPGTLASGDNRGRIYLWDMCEGATWAVNQLPLTGHSGSVEDIQWSPTEQNVLSSCSSDGSICLWDARVKPSDACVIKIDKAHDKDVNVISWNHKDPFLLSGGDDGVLKIWDLKSIQGKEPACIFNHHEEPITSVQWCQGPEGEGTVFAASSEDNQVTIWDIGVEPDTESKKEEENSLPPQLLFMHMGQKEVKEIHWHPNITGSIISTALNGFNIFRTISI